MIKIDDLLTGSRFGWAHLASGETANAEFVLSGRETQLNLADSTNGIGEPSIPQIDVSLMDGRKLSFVQNIRTEAVRYHGGAGSLVTYMPHFVAIGTSHLASEQKIASIAFHVHDANAVLDDFDAFSIDIAADRDRISEIVQDRFERIGRTTEVGDRPIIAYFTGKFEIFSACAKGLRFSARHQPSHGMGGPDGISIQNKILFSIDFDPPASLDDAIVHLITFLRFLQLVAGRKQMITGLRIKVDGAQEHDWHALHWCLAWTADGLEGDRPHPADVLVNGGINSEDFGSLLANWFDTDSDAIDARVRFSRSFEAGRNYYPDRLVAAANAFDLLPSARFSAPMELSEAEQAAQKAAQAAFKAVPRSEISMRALSDLGRLGTHNLKSLVLQRFAKVEARAGGRLSGLDLVLRDAVDARNHFVHGTSATPAKAQLFRDFTPFYTRALEAVFGMAELVDCGWKLNEWSREAKGMSHPYSEFIVTFRADLADYMAQRDSK